MIEAPKVPSGPRDPREWRKETGKTLADVASLAGIAGRNPSRTYARYETGDNQCPANVIEAVRVLSAGAVTGDSWQRVRVNFLSAGASAAEGAP
jgi:transcriptional regulator with XRE-family HTH domain